MPTAISPAKQCRAAGATHAAAEAARGRWQGVKRAAGAQSELQRGARGAKREVRALRAAGAVQQARCGTLRRRQEAARRSRRSAAWR
jgi:hypothetical protein